MSRSRELLQEKIAQFGPCRSQSQEGLAAMYGCILWNGHEGDHKRFGQTWAQGAGYEPTEEEIAALEEGEEQDVEMFGPLGDGFED